MAVTAARMMIGSNQNGTTPVFINSHRHFANLHQRGDCYHRLLRSHQLPSLQQNRLARPKSKVPHYSWQACWSGSLAR